LALALAGCQSRPPRDPHIVRNPGKLDENRELISPPTLGQPIYACSSNVTITNFLQHAKLNVFINGAPAPNPSVIGDIPIPGINFDTGHVFVAGDTVFVTQTVDGVTSGPSNTVPVTSHTEDYPAGLPKPRLFKHPLRQCGHAVLVEDVVPGSTVSVFSEKALGGGVFDTPVTVGGFNASTEWGLNWTGVNPQFELGARVSAQAKLCTDTSQRSDFEITELAPSPMPAGSIEPPVIEGQSIVTIWGASGPGDPPQHGPIITVYDDAANVRGKTPIPGGVAHNMGINPAGVAGEALSVTQTLCEESVPGTTVPVEPCSAMPAPVIKPPLPGDTKVYVLSSIPGAEILVFAGAEEVGHSSGAVINLSRALNAGEIVTVMQRLGECESAFVYQIEVKCALGDAPGACSADWPAFRHNGLRTARQVQSSPLADPYAVKTLEVKADTSAPDGGQFTASPVVYNGNVYIGSSNGHLYAYDANFSTGAAPLWQYPPAGETALTSQWATAGPCANPSSSGIAASVAIAEGREGALVILGAPDQGRPDDPGGKFGSGLGSGRVFALTPIGLNLVWKTREEVARLSGTVSGSTTQFHEQIGYSAPLVLNNRIYVGIANHCDNPIQNGRVKAIDLNTGDVLPTSGFAFASTSDRGGGIWTYVSGGLAGGIVTTTGNVKNGTSSEPLINHALSMVRLNPATGALEGKIQPVPYDLDYDPDWSAGATLMAASCGPLAVSTMKDGWTYAGNLGPPLAFRWQFPNTAYPFPGNDPLDHGDIRYHRAGAAWNDVYISMAGGEDIVAKEVDLDIFQGYARLHAVNACSGHGSRVRWIAHLDAFTLPITSHHSWGLGPPTVTHGIVYVGTNDGFLLALADPSVWPAQAARCTLPQLDGLNCLNAGFQMVPNPTVLRDIELGGNMTRTEPVIANGSLYVANSQGRLFRIAPK
jgi:outer membrane protein assembly factor BamB